MWSLIRTSGENAPDASIDSVAGKSIAGSYVIEGLIRRNSQMRLVRDSVQIYVGKLTSLRRFKEDAREVQSGYECGIGLEGFNDIKEGDIIEAYEIEEVAATLN